MFHQIYASQQILFPKNHLHQNWLCQIQYQMFDSELK